MRRRASGFSVSRLVLVATAFLLAIGATRAADWPQWLGTERDGVWREAGLAEIGDCAQEARDQLLALFTGFVLLQQQVAEPLLKPIDFVQRGVLRQIREQPYLLLGFEVMTMAPHQRHQSTVLRTGRVDLAPASQEVVVDETDHMEAVGDDESVGEVELDDGAIDRRQVHADDTNLIFALQGNEIGLQRGFRASQSEVVNAMILQIAEGRGVPFFPGEEVFVDAQDLGTNWRVRRSSGSHPPYPNTGHLCQRGDPLLV